MKKVIPQPPGDSSEEIAALIETLHQTGQRLEELTAGEVDTVADREGRTFVLRSAQERLRYLEAAKQSAILNALPANIALLDTHGVIRSVNEAWGKFADANLCLCPSHAVGVNYLDICDRARGADSFEARQAAAGIRSVVSGAAKFFSLEYSCHSPTEQRWFLMTVTPLADSHRNGAVVLHLNITENKLAQGTVLRENDFIHGMLNSMPGLFYLINDESRFIRWNKNFETVSGYSSEEIPNISPTDLFAGAEKEIIAEKIRQVFDTGEATVEAELVAKNNTQTRYFLTGAKILIGRAPFLIGTGTDVTLRTRATTRIKFLNRVYAMLSNINALIVRVHSRDELYCEACRIAVEEGGFRMSLLGILDQGTKKIVPVASAGKGEELLTAVKARLSTSGGTPESMVEQTVREKKAVIANDSLNDSRLLFPGNYAESGVRSLAVLPLMIADEAVGVFALYAGEVDFFREEELNLLTELTGNIAFALTNIAKEEKIARLSRIRAVMGAINALIVRVQGRQMLLDEACRIAMNEGGFGIAWIGMLDRQTLNIIPTAWAGVDAASMMEDAPPSADNNARLGQGIVGRAVREKRAVFSNDIATESSPGGVRRREALRRGYRSLIALPLVVGGETVGSLALFAKEQEFFDDEEVTLLTELADNVSFALDNIRKSEALEYSEKQLDSILSTVKEVVWSMDPQNGRLVYINAAIRHLTRQAAVGFLAHPRVWRRMIHRQDRARLRRGVRSLLRGHSLTIEFRIVLADGEELTVECSARVRRDATGKAKRIDGILVDITERRRAEVALRQLNDELEDKVTLRTADVQRGQQEAESASEAKSSFLAAMSHEIRTPMNGVIGMMDVLQQSSLNDDQIEMVDLIRESAFSLLGIINDILDFSKIEAGKLEIEREAVAVAEVVEGVCSLLNGMADKNDVAVFVYTDPAIPTQVLGDALRLRQVLVNLVGNAIKFSSGQSRSGRVSVRALLIERSPVRLMVEVQVIDNGIGMDEEAQGRLFTAFTQADATTTRRFGGTGLGLIIANRLVQLMNGEITVQSAPDKGSTFKVRLPFTLPPTESDTIEVASEVAGLRCVVVGSADGLADDLAAYLEHAHANVERASDLASARVQTAGRSGMAVWVVDASDVPQRREQVPAITRAQANQDVRLVVVLIERGRRRRPRAAAPDVITIDGNALNRRTFLHTVAVAAGRASLEREPVKRISDTSLRIAPSHDEALRQGQLILIAEDNETNQKVIVRQLALLGYTADVAADGREALEHWKSREYALLLTDLHMPKMDGYELTEAIRAEEKDGKRIPIIALTANALKGEADHCLAAGMDDYRSKPAPLAELKSVLEKWMPIAKSAADASVSSTLSATATQAEMPAPVDVSVLEGLVGDDPELVREFLKDFRGSAAEIASELRAACSTGQTKAAVAAAHKLKSSARAVGASALGVLCEAMEQEGKASDTDALNVLLPRFETEMALVEDYLDKLR